MVLISGLQPMVPSVRHQHQILIDFCRSCHCIGSSSAFYFRNRAVECL